MTMTTQTPADQADGTSTTEQGTGMTSVSGRASTFESALDATRSGDGGGFEQLYRLFARRIAAYVTVRGAAEPEEIANEVLFRVFNKLDDFSGDESAFSAWVFTIAHNLAVDSHRATARRPNVVDSAIPDPPAIAAESIALDNIERDRLLSLIDTLTDAQRDVILLRMVADLSVKQVATTLNKPITAIKALQRRGLRQLATALTDISEDQERL